MFSQAIRGLTKFCCQYENDYYLVWFKDKQQYISFFNTAVRKLIYSFFVLSGFSLTD